MTYPPGPPGNPGYQPAQSPGQYGASNPPSFAKSTDDSSKIPFYLQVAVVVTGLLAYLVSYGPMLVPNEGDYVGLRGDVGYVIPAAVLAALLAAVGLLPKAKNYHAVIAAVAVVGALLAISQAMTAGEFFSVGWALWLVLGLTIVQAIAAVVGLLLDAGVVAAPSPRPKYDPYAQYGLPPGGGYYGQPGSHSGPVQQVGPSGYPSYGGYPSGPSTGGFGLPSAPPPPQPTTGGFGTGPQYTPPPGPPTPPTGLPSFGPPPGSGSATGEQSQGSADADQAQQTPGDQASSSAPPTQP
ncbi:MAG TPA: DUF5336 domain-containing protein [Mycobacterium sp.]|nr:DUF5336 domain-containing protein [Mycobacterium sp.]